MQSGAHTGRKLLLTAITTLVCLVVAATPVTARTAQSAPSAPSSAPAMKTSRVAGADRYDTAARLSAGHFPTGVDVAFVASGQQFADALTGGPAAARTKSPLLLTKVDDLPESTSNELARLRPARIVVLGGVTAVSDAVLQRLGAFTNGSVTRQSGPDRWATAAAIAKASWPAGADTVLIVNGNRFADALAGGAAGAALDAPILLVSVDSIPEATRTELQRLQPDRIQILGGEASVSNAVVNDLAGLASTTGRWAGTDRYDTARAVADGAFGHVDTALVTTGTGFADALAASTAAGTLGAPVLLSTKDCIPDEVATLLADMDPASLLLVGGTNALSDAVLTSTPCEPIPKALSFRVLYLVPDSTQPLNRTARIRDVMNEMNEWVAAETEGRRIRLQRTDGKVTVTTVRLPTGMSGSDFTGIYTHLVDRGFITQRQQVAAFTEAAGGSCGRGGAGLALIWTKSCGSAFETDDPQHLLGPFAGIMIHEILHSFGAVPACAPNHDAAHIQGGSPDRDIMLAGYNPYLDVSLDPGRDDYYGHGGIDCVDVERSRYWERAPAAQTTSTTTQ